MDDLIRRQAALEALEWKWAGKAAIDAIKNLPSAQSEIVRCKDCKHFNRSIPCVGGVYDGCDELTDDGNEMPVDEDFYCGYAERKDNG